MELTFQEVVKEYRRRSGRSVRGFADWLMEDFVNASLSGQTISRWENEINLMPKDIPLFFDIFTTYTDERRYFAVDALKALMPHVFDSGMVTFHIPSRQ